jgi:hypothetical protein
MIQNRSEIANNEITILERIIMADPEELNLESARHVLTLGFSVTDKSRMHKLAAKNRSGTLSADEEAELESYRRVGALLSTLKSKARRILKKKQ